MDIFRSNYSDYGDVQLAAEVNDRSSFTLLSGKASVGNGIYGMGFVPMTGMGPSLNVSYQYDLSSVGITPTMTDLLPDYPTQGQAHANPPRMQTMVSGGGLTQWIAQNQDKLIIGVVTAGIAALLFRGRR